MKKLGKNNAKFPEHESEFKEWKTIFSRHILHHQVMCLAKTRIEGAWNAYIFPVPGINHDEEEYLWEREGEKLPEKIALVLFPRFEGIPYAK